MRVMGFRPLRILGRTGTGACPYAGMKRCWWVPASAGMTEGWGGKDGRGAGMALVSQDLAQE